MNRPSLSRVKPAGPETVREAASLLRDGDLVAFPTETVYGLGADATNGTAVAQIFAAKGRPRFNPLIVHVPSVEAAARLARLSPMAEAVAERFWPGPLTLVLEKRQGSGLSELVTAGLPTVAIRVPALLLAQDLLRATGRPVAAPSANASGRVSPTTADHVNRSLPKARDGGPALVLDGGPCDVGLESTILDLSTPAPTVLRPGGIALEDLEAVTGPLSSARLEDPEAPKAPGMLTRHYAPRVPLRLNAESPGPGEAFLAFGDCGVPGTLNLSPSGNVTEAAANLFACLHALDAGAWDAIAVAPIPDKGLGQAINDRLRRGAAG